MNSQQQEQFVRGIMDNYPEAGSGNELQCFGYNYERLEFTFEDSEGKSYILDKAKLMAALPLMFTEKWPKGCTQPHRLAFDGVTDDQVDDWLCEADAVDFDAFVQLACLGEVIYG